MEATSGVDPGVVSLPSGGGALRSIGEKFQPDLLRGTGNYSVTIEVPAGPAGIKPALKLTYSTGQGNGAFGLGWQLSGPIAITRSSERGLPRFDETDELLLGGDVLVDVGGARFRPRSDTQSWDIRREGEGWRIRMKDGRSLVLGSSAAARQEHEGQVLAWMCETEFDAAGNAIHYAYISDRGQHYLSEVAWGIWAVRIRYEEREDVLASCRSGHEVKTALRATRIERHCSRTTPSLTSAYVLSYEHAPGSGLSLLAKVQLEAIDQDGEREEFPPITFAYSSYSPDPLYLSVKSADERLPLGRPGTALVDMDGDGLPDLLETDGVGHRYWKNIGGGAFGSARPIPGTPFGLRLGEPGTTFADLTGDGTADLVRADTRLRLAALNTGEGEWDETPLVLDRQFPLSISSASSRLVDLTGDGLPDLLQSTVSGFMIAYNLGDGDFTEPENLARLSDAELFPNIDLNDPSVHLADMNGDGLADVVEIRSGIVAYWPSLGFGRFGPRVDMTGAPVFPQGFSAERLFLADLDGDGTVDLVFVDFDRILYWLNRSGQGWSERFELAFVPPPNIETLSLVDLLGSGSQGLCWTQPGPVAGAARFLSLGGATKPYLLETIQNGFGASTAISYASTSTLRIDGGEDRWKSYLPFPLHVVTSLSDEDSITGEKTDTKIAYADGYFDPVERLFRGFRTVELTSVGDAHTPTTVQRTTFELGAMQGPKDRLRRTPQERGRDHAIAGSILRTELFELDALGKRIPVNRADLKWDARIEFTDGERFVFFPHLVSTLATDIGEDGTERIEQGDYVYDAYGNVTSKTRTSRFADEPAEAALGSIHEVEYALNEELWRVGLPSRISTRDGAGNLLDDKRIYYDGNPFFGLPAGEIRDGIVRRSEELALADRTLPAGYSAMIDPDWKLRHEGDGWYREVEAYDHDALGNIVAHRMPLGAVISIEYDADRLFPVEVADEQGRKTKATFDPRSGQPLSVTTPDGLNTVYQYSPLGRLRGQFDTLADGSLELTEFHSVAYAVAEAGGTRPASLASVRLSEAGGDLEDLEAADLEALEGAAIEFSYYDGRGNLLQTSRRASDPAARWVAARRRRYTRSNAPAAEFPNAFAQSADYLPPDPAGPAVRFRYSPTGQARRIENPDGGRFSVRYNLRTIEKRDAETGDADVAAIENYNAWGQLTGSVVPDGTGGVAETRYAVDHAGRVLAITDADGTVTTRYTYAGPGSPVAIEHINAGARTYFRDAAEQLRLRTDSAGRSLKLDYDGHGRLSVATDVTDPANPKVVRSLSYAANGLVRSEEMGVVATFVNDRLGRPLESTLDYGNGDTLTLTRQYGLHGEVRELSYPDGSRIDLNYYASGAVQSLDGVVDEVRYDAHDNPLEIRFAGGLEANYSLEPASNRLTSIALKMAGTDIRRLQFGYNLNGCITSALDTIDGQTMARAYRYDGLLRLVQSTTRKGGVAGQVLRDDAYEYSLTGDILRNGETGDTRLHYEDAGHPGLLSRVDIAGQSQQVQSDQLGRLTGFGEIEDVGYDIWDRIERVTLANGTKIEFAYDHQGRQVRRIATKSDGTRSEMRFCEGLYEETATGNRCNIYIGKLLVAVRTAPNAAGPPATAIVLTDQLGSILTTCSPAGVVLHHQAYTPFGMPLLQVQEDSRYTGVSTDPSCGMIQLGARWYHPLLGRFVTPDWFILENPKPALRLPQALNVYSYAINNPVMLRDPSGKFFGLDDLIVAAVGFVVGFVTGIIVGIAEGRSFGDTLLLGLEAGLLGAAGAWLAYVTMGAALSLLGCVGLGVGSGVATGLTISAAVIGGLNGVISGSLRIYNWSDWTGWAAFTADSTWGLLGTGIGVLLHGVNLFYGNRNYSFALSRRQNRHVYDGGFAIDSGFAFTQGNVISNLRGLHGSLADHESSHILQNRIFGPLFTVSYVAWLVVGGFIGLILGIFVNQSIGQSMKDVGYYDNPWEDWAYAVGGSPNGGKLSWI